MNLSARRARMKKFSSVIVKLELISRDRQTRGGGGGTWKHELAFLTGVLIILLLFLISLYVILIFRSLRFPPPPPGPGGGGPPPNRESRISLFTRSSMSDAFSPGSGIYRYIRTIYMHV